MFVFRLHAPPPLLLSVVVNQRHIEAWGVYYSVSTARCVFEISPSLRIKYGTIVFVRVDGASVLRHECVTWDNVRRLVLCCVPGTLFNP